MLTLFKTTDKEEALRYERNAIRILGHLAVYRFQYQSSDGNFYYEILLGTHWLGFKGWHDPEEGGPS